MKNRNLIIVGLAVIIIVSLGGFYLIQSMTPQRTRKLVVSTTTSLYDTGVLDKIEEDFEAKNSIDLYFISVGTGLAITHAQRGDADMILVHAPSRELAFMEEGFGVNRKIIAYNFFSIVGPRDDPAGIMGESPIEALQNLVNKAREGDAIWVSRGDDSGTHSKEKALWTHAGYDLSSLREEDWYREAGTGMGKTLQIAEEFGAYTLTDIGTFFKYSKEGLVTSELIVGEGEELINIYSALAVDPNANSDADFDAAMKFIEYLVSEEGQIVFEEYGVDEYGSNLFNPAINLLSTNQDPILVKWLKKAGFLRGEECPSEFQQGEYNLYK